MPKLKQHDENMIQNGVNYGLKWYQICEDSGSRGGLELLGDPPDAKMAQDARRVASGAAFLELLSFILALRWAKIAPRWAKLDPS